MEETEVVEVEVEVEVVVAAPLTWLARTSSLSQNSLHDAYRWATSCPALSAAAPASVSAPTEPPERRIGCSVPLDFPASNFSTSAPPLRGRAGATRPL